jgi:hypothetical protein
MDKFLKIAIVLGAVDKASQVISNAVAKSSKQLQSLGKSNQLQEGLDRFGNRALIAGTALTGFFSTTVAAAEESEVATARLTKVFDSMGEKTGEAARKAADYASTLSMQLGVEDELILAAQAKLATFQNVSNETARMSGIFDRATNAAFDLAAAGFGEAGQNAVQLGKALQDPIKGIQSLARSGVTFTAEEKKKIKALVDSGRMLDAQKVVLAAIEKQVGGAGKATATNSAKMKVAWGELQETIGKTLLPAVNKISKWLTDVVPKIQAFIDRNKGLVSTLAIGAAALIGLGFAAKVGALALGGFNLVVKASMAIQALWGAVSMGVAVFQRTGSATMALTSVMRALNLTILMNPFVLIAAAIIAAVYLVYKYWDQIKAFFIKLWESIKQIFIRAWEFIKGLFFKYHPYGILIKNWDKIVQWFADIWTKVKAKFQAWIDWFKGLGKMFFDAGKNIMSSIWNGMKAMASKPIEAMKDTMKKIREYLPFSPAKRGPLMDIHRVKIMETIAQSVKPAALTDKMNSAMRTVRQSLNTSISANVNGGSSFGGKSSGGSITYAPVVTITGGSPESVDSFRKMLADHKTDIVRIMRSENDRRERTSF